MGCGKRCSQSTAAAAGVVLAFGPELGSGCARMSPGLIARDQITCAIKLADKSAEAHHGPVNLCASWQKSNVASPIARRRSSSAVSGFNKTYAAFECQF